MFFIPKNKKKDNNEKYYIFGTITTKKTLHTIIQFGLPMAHKFILASSPPVTITRPDFCPKAKHVTADPWATNSSDCQIFDEKIYDQIMMDENVTCKDEKI